MTHVNADLASRQAQLEELCRRYGVRSLEIFGSAARGEAQSGASDLDFLVEFEPSPPGGYANAFFGLLEALEELFDRPVDLVVASAITNPFFRTEVERTKVLLYAA